MSGLESDFKELLSATATVAKHTGVNSHGEDTYSSITASYSVMTVRGTKQVRNKDNELKVSNAQTYFMDDFTIDPDDQITLPDGSKPIILYIGAWTDELGKYVQCVYT